MDVIMETPPSRPSRKAQHFLNDVERYMIVQRLDQGETQAALAKAFEVTRATICNIKKNRVEICQRYEMLAATVEGQQKIEEWTHTARLAANAGSLRIVHTTTTQVLLTRLRDAGTDAATAMAAVQRLQRILLEDVLASFGTTKTMQANDIQHAKTTTTMTTTTNYTRRFCAVVVGSEPVSPLLEDFQRMEPSAVYGTIHVARSMAEQGGDGLWHVTAEELPTDIAECNIVMLHVACIDVALVWAVLEALRAHNIGMPRICLTSLVCTASAVATLTSACPNLKVVTMVVIEDPPLASSLLLARLTATER